MQLLQKFIRETLLSERADAHITQEISDKILNSMNLEPIPRGDDLTGKLGAGTFGVAYEVLHNGKRIVAKLTTDKQEADSARKTKAIKNGIPTEYGKHLPTFHGVKTVELSGITYYVIISEYLNPIPKSIKALVFEDGGLGSDEFTNAVILNMKNALNDVEALKDKVKTIIDNAYVNATNAPDRMEKKNKLILTNSATSLTINFLKNKVKNKKISSTSSWDIVVPILWSVWNDMISDEIDFDPAYVNTEIKNLFYNEKNKFPVFHDDIITEPEFKDKRVQELYDAMKWLEENDIAKWGDLHRENVLMRGKDTLVAADVGLFSYVKQRKRNKKK